MIYLAASILAFLNCLSDIPAALNRANKEHIDNGRRPNAGLAIALDLMVMILLWCLGTLIIDTFFGRTWAWLLLVGYSTGLLVWNLLRSRKSNREYRSYLHSRSDAEWPAYTNKSKAIQRWTHPSGDERIYLILRSDGTYTISYEKYSTDKHDNCWIPYGISGSIYESKEIAIKEAESDHAWIADVTPVIRHQL